MRKSRGCNGCFPEGLCEDCIDEVEISGMFQSRWIAAANNSVKFLVDFGLRLESIQFITTRTVCTASCYHG